MGAGLDGEGDVVCCGSRGRVIVAVGSGVVEDGDGSPVDGFGLGRGLGFGVGLALGVGLGVALGVALDVGPDVGPVVGRGVGCRTAPPVAVGLGRAFGLFAAVGFGSAAEGVSVTSSSA